MTAAALRFAPPIRCHRELGPGEVKRIGVGRTLVGYFVGCPACGIVGQVAGDAFVETLPLVELPAGTGISARTMRPTALATREPIECRGCGRGVVVRDERVEIAP